MRSTIGLGQPGAERGGGAEPVGRAGALALARGAAARARARVRRRARAPRLACHHRLLLPGIVLKANTLCKILGGRITKLRGGSEL